MIAFNQITIPESLYMTVPIENEELLLNADCSNFDREGYELLPIEQEFYKANKIGLDFKEVFAKESGQNNGWSAAIQPFAYQNDSNTAYLLDHSFCVFRYGFEGEARNQLLNAFKHNPQLAKLIHIIPKIGIDFCLDVIFEDGRLEEIIHIEWDFRSVDEFKVCLEIIKNKLSHAGYDSILGKILASKNNFTNAKSDDIGDFKARLFGFTKAFDLYKSF